MSPPQASLSLEVIFEPGDSTHVNMMRSQSPDGRVVPKSRPAGWQRGTSSMPTDFSWRCITSNVRARSWLPDVVEKRNDSLPMPGHEKILSLLALGLSGPPVQPLPLRMLITFVWLKGYAAYALT